MKAFEQREHPRTIVLFDVDGTLTPARQRASSEILELLQELRNVCAIGFVGGSDLAKQREQLGPNVVDLFDFCFAENGLTAYRLGEQLASQSFISWLGEVRYAKLINFCLRYIADLDIPVKRGTFIEFRNGMVNVSPIGRNASIQERIKFEQYDIVTKTRERFVEALKAEFLDYGLKYSIGGQISFDVFPEGWDKTYCLRHVLDDPNQFETIHFFGDKVYPGGNDWEIFTDTRVVGHAVRSPNDTIQQLKELFYT